VELLERETQLRQLSAAFDLLVRGGSGACALVLGEAGVGKTSLVRRELKSWRGRADIYCGACEALFTPRPLGPIADFAGELPPGLAAQVHSGNTHNGLFPAFLAFLRDRSRPAVLVIEDAHWADEATLDFIKYLGRRLDGTRALLVVTLRDDEVGLDHPLRRVLGDLPASFTKRITLAPLSRGAVEKVARAAGRDADALYRFTGGNPFYVGELLGVPGQAVPASVRDAVLARFGRLGATAQRVVELVAIEPGRLERAVVDALQPGAAEAVREACDGGVLRIDADWLAFRHEIARRCIEQELPEHRCAELHAQVLDVLRRDTVAHHGLSREVHHAIGAGRNDEVGALAPRAAEAAARLGSHREAAALYERALVACGGIDAAARADLLEAAAIELQKTGALQEAIERREEALALRRGTGDRQREGVNLRLLGVLHRQSSGDKAQFMFFAQTAVDVLEPLGPSGELAKAYASLSHVLCLLSDIDNSIDWGERAVKMAQQSGDEAALALALNRHGTAQLYKSNDAQARALLERALTLAVDARFEGLAAEIHICMQTGAIIHHDNVRALEVGRRGIAYCEARDFDGAAFSLRLRCAYSLVNLGCWREAELEYAQCAAAPNASALVHATCEYALRRQQVRRGDLPAAASGLAQLSGDVDEFWRAVQTQLHTLQVEFKPPAIAAGCAEAAWLRGDHATALEVAGIGLADALAADDGRLAGPLLVWLARLGDARPRLDVALLPACALELAGQRTAAAAEWERLNNPYEQALVLAFGDENDMRAAVNRFAALGAARAAAATRNRLRSTGARNIERGPYGHAREHTFGFTRRENEIAELLCQGLSNAAIAQRLHRSERTVEHHVAKVLAKLDVTSRAQALLKLSNLRQTAEN
jgi:DNA-binding CsgD family transcriptional regulator/tetratricopeptide (TPR) repeat protein